MTVLDDVCVFGAVKHWHGSLITFSSDVIICRVDGDGHQVHEKVTDKCNCCTLSSELKTDNLSRLAVCSSHRAVQGSNFQGRV